MPRRPRNYIPGYPYHVYQRGTNRTKTFLHVDDYRLYLNLWRKYANFYEMDVHAYCLMPNHIHFLVTPSEADTISLVTQVVGSTYASYFNERYRRTGTLWEGRHKSSLVDTETYLLTCYRYIDLNPVRAGIVGWPHEYDWSSYRLNTTTLSSWLVPHPVFKALDISPVYRIAIYQGLCEEPVPTHDLLLIRTNIDRGMPIASRDTIEALQIRHGVRFGRERRGRPPNQGTAVDQK